MKLKLASDLHIEHWKNTPNLGTGDILILAGDVISAKYLKTNGENQQIAMKFFEKCSQNFKHIIYIEGNHSFYGCRYENVFDDVKSVLPKNFIHLENDKVKIGDYWFVGAVMWTDFDHENPFSMLSATRYMNDYSCIKYGPVYRKFRPEDVLKIHKETLSYFKSTLDELKDEKVIMITHHLPSSQSVHSMYRGEMSNSYYHNSLDEWIMNCPQIKYWLCGHTHHAHHYIIGDECKVYCNPRGYPGENTEFNENFELELT